MSTPRSEKVKNYLIGIGALTGLILGLLAQFKGEPVAEKTWITLRDQVNRQTELINDLYTQLEVLRAVQEARAAVELEHEIEELRKQYDDLSSSKTTSTRKPRKAGSKPSRVSKAPEEVRIKRLEEMLEKEALVNEFIESDMPAEQRMLETLPQSLEEASK